MLAPIGISTYKRLDHLKQTINALKSNAISKSSRLYIFSDAPRAGDEEAVNELRDYLNHIDGFSEVVVIERVSNSRVYNNRNGLQYLLDKYGKTIFMEEDIVTQPGFLEFMNCALEYYKDNANIISISGYTPPIKIPEKYSNDVFFLQRFNGWGFGTWRHKFIKINQNIDKCEYIQKINDRNFYKKLALCGEDIPRLVDKDARGMIDALDVKIMYQQALNDWYTVYPRISLAQNIGHDGSGLHCIMTDKFHHDRLWDKVREFEFLEDVYVDSRIVSANKRFRRLSIIGKLAEYMRRLRSSLS
jgi:hypothetical protein